MANGRPRVKASKPRHLRTKVSVRNSSAAENMAASFYNEVNPQKKQEIMDSRMMQEDHNAIANLSGNSINKQFNPNRFMQTLGRFDELHDVGELHGKKNCC